MFDLPVGVVVVDRRYDIQYINDAARSFLNIRGTALGDDLIHLVESTSSSELRRMIDRAFEGEAMVEGRLNVSDSLPDATRHVEVMSRADGDAEEAQGRAIICVLDVSTEVRERNALGDELRNANAARDRAEEHRVQLSETNRELLRANQQLTRELAELRSQNEEFLVGNEELQSATEEVETLNEEPQATNEELETLNEELQATVEELNTTNDDLQTRNLEIQDLAIRHESTRARLQTALNALPEAIAVVDREGNTSVTNLNFERLFGGDLKRAKLLNEQGKTLKADEAPYERAAQGESFQMRFGLECDNRLQIYEVAGEPIGDGGNAGSVLIIRSVTGGPA